MLNDAPGPAAVEVGLAAAGFTVGGAAVADRDGGMGGGISAGPDSAAAGNTAKASVLMSCFIRVR